MKRSVLSLALGLAAAPAMAVVTFETPTYPGVNMPIDAIDGWTASEPNDVFMGDSFPIFYTQAGANGSTFGTIGGAFFAPNSDPYTASRDFAVAPTLGTSTFSFQMSLTDSYNDVGAGFDGTGIRNDYGLLLTTGSGSLLKVDFLAENQGGAVNSENWAVWYTIGGTMTPVSTGFAVQPGALTKISVAFDGSELAFSLGADDGSGPQPVFTGTPVGYTPGGTDDVNAEFSFTQGSAGEFSNNSISLDNIQIVPEPSALMLLGLSALGFVRRRR